MDPDSQVLRVVHFRFSLNPWRYTYPTEETGHPRVAFTCLLSPMAGVKHTGDIQLSCFGAPLLRPRGGANGAPLLVHYHPLYMRNDLDHWITSAKCTFEGLAI
jgi:hypothetical protein